MNQIQYITKLINNSKAKLSDLEREQVIIAGKIELLNTMISNLNYDLVRAVEESENEETHSKAIDC